MYSTAHFPPRPAALRLSHAVLRAPARPPRRPLPGPSLRACPAAAEGVLTVLALIKSLPGCVRVPSVGSLSAVHEGVGVRCMRCAFACKIIWRQGIWARGCGHVYNSGTDTCSCSNAEVGRCTTQGQACSYNAEVARFGWGMRQQRNMRAADSPRAAHFELRGSSLGQWCWGARRQGRPPVFCVRESDKRGFHYKREFSSCNFWVGLLRAAGGLGWCLCLCRLARVSGIW